MDQEKRDMEMAIARSMVDHQRLESEKKSQEDLMEQQMKKLSVQTSASATPGNILKILTIKISRISAHVNVLSPHRHNMSEI